MKFKSHAQRKAVMANLNRGRTKSTQYNIIAQDKPKIRFGKSEKEAIAFAERNRGWNTYHEDKDTIRIIKSLEKKGEIETNKFGMFRYKSQKSGLKKETKKTLDFFAKTDMKTYGKITPSTKKAFKVQKEKLPKYATKSKDFTLKATAETEKEKKSKIAIAQLIVSSPYIDRKKKEKMLREIR